MNTSLNVWISNEIKFQVAPPSQMGDGNSSGNRDFWELHKLKRTSMTIRVGFETTEQPVINHLGGQLSTKRFPPS